jgi:hypothetical protein
MYKYKIGYAGWDTAHFDELEHTKKFTKTDLLDMISRAVILKTTYRTEKDYLHSFEDFHDNVIEYLVLTEGFVRVQYEETVCIDSSQSLFDIYEKDDYEYETSTDHIQQKLKDAGFTKKDDSYDW